MQELIQCCGTACSLETARAQQDAAAYEEGIEEDSSSDESSLDEQEANACGPHQVAMKAEQGMQGGPSMDNGQSRSSHLPVPAKQPPAAPCLTPAKKAAEPPSAQKAAALHTATLAKGGSLSPICSVKSGSMPDLGSYTILQDTVLLHDRPELCPTL